MEHRQLADWLGVAIVQVSNDVAQSRGLVHDAAGRLNATFDTLASHVHLVEHLHPAVEALQFEDVVAQLLERVLLKLDAVRQLCEVTANDPQDPRIAGLRVATEELLACQRVGAQEIAAGEVELF